MRRSTAPSRSTTQQLADVAAALERRFGRKLETTVVVVPELIGGVRVIVGDEVLDTSVQRPPRTDEGRAHRLSRPPRPTRAS